MKKSLLVATLLLVGSTSIMATEVKESWFGGLELGNTKIKQTTSIAGSESSGSDTGASYSLKIGKYLGKAGRVYAIYTGYNTDTNVDLKSYGIGYDYLFYNESKFTPFIGLSAGKSSYTQSGLQAALVGTGVTSNKDSIDVSGAYYGINLGSLYTINKNFDVEFGLRVTKSNAKDSAKLSDGTTTLTANFETDRVIQGYVGINYNF